jgi:hypothetical protein
MTGKGIKPRGGKGSNAAGKGSNAGGKASGSPANKASGGPADKASGSPANKAPGRSGGLAANKSPGGRSAAGQGSGSPGAPRQRVIPDAVANRMARRIAIATGVPTVLGMGVFIASYLLVSRSILDIPPALTLVSSGACFLLGVVGLSYGVLSASWEDAPGSLLGREQIGVNMARLRSSIRSMRSGSPNG